jgi:hypothetical protein
MVSTQASGALQFFVYDGVSFAVQLDTPTSSITTGAWYHVAIDSNGTKVRLYINGTPIVSQTPTSTTAGQPPLAVILGRDLLGGRSFNGWLDEVRITKGIARYNTDSGFAAPTAAFPRL